MLMDTTPGEDRMLHGAYPIVLDGESYRKPREEMDKQKKVEKE